LQQVQVPKVWDPNDLDLIFVPFLMMKTPNHLTALTGKKT